MCDGILDVCGAFFTAYNLQHSDFFSLSSPGQLTCNDPENENNPKLWVALSGGRVVVFDASRWSMLHDCIQVGHSQLVRTERLETSACFLFFGATAAKMFKL